MKSGSIQITGQVVLSVCIHVPHHNITQSGNIQERGHISVCLEFRFLQLLFSFFSYFILFFFWKILSDQSRKYTSNISFWAVKVDEMMSDMVILSTHREKNSVSIQLFSFSFFFFQNVHLAFFLFLVYRKHRQVQRVESNRVLPRINQRAQTRESNCWQLVKAHPCYYVVVRFHLFLSVKHDDESLFYFSSSSLETKRNRRRHVINRLRLRMYTVRFVIFFARPFVEPE